MSLLDRLSDADSWQAFYEYRAGLACPKQSQRELRDFIDTRGWQPVTEAIQSGSPFPLPRKAVISKLGTAKKRTVYIYPKAESTVLKLLTHLLLRKYDALFDDGLYSFRPGRTAKDAVRRFVRLPQADRLYAYKADVHDYFNSVPVDRLLPQLSAVTADDPALYGFLSRLLTEPCVLENGAPAAERKGIMAGTPLSAFYANLYLQDLDRHFAEAGAAYARYSDDIIVFGSTPEEVQAQADFIRQHLCGCGLALNPDKECFYTPKDGWTFLGFSCKNGRIDIAPATVTKLKQKMRRKTRALQRWRQRNGLPGEKAAAAFVRIFNRKLLEGPDDNELTWSRWFFSVINTTESLREIDAYAQDCLRYLVSGTRTKARYNVRYENLKRLGYRSLVHAYYAFQKEQGSLPAPTAPDRT